MQMIKPYKDEHLNVLYNQLFCDMPSLYNAGSPQQKEYPWNVVLDNAAADERLLAVTADPEVESRMKLLAYNQLKAKGSQADKKELLGVIIEVPLEHGLDVIAAYKDGTARYINQAEKLVVWETNTNDSEKLIDDLFTESQKVVDRIGAWDKERPAQPGVGQVRLNFLVSDGLYFGQGPFEVLAKDAIGGPVIHAATQILLFLTGKVTA